MELSKAVLLIYFLTVSVISFSIVGIDKCCAVGKKSRVPEKTFFLLSLIGGSAAVYLGMTVFNHKTQKNSFVFLIPLIFAMQCAVVCLLYKYDIYF